MKEPRVRYYDSFTDDFEQSHCQDYELPQDYEWIKKGAPARVLSALTYTAAFLFSSVYCRVVLRMHVKNKRVLRDVKGGFFLYANHTQPLGDVFMPGLAVLPRRVYTVVSTANYGIPVIGKLLPYLGALPVEHSMRGVRELRRAIEARSARGNGVVIFPEAHVWEYYTKIRPFPRDSFYFPARSELPSFALTATYKKTRGRRRPRMDLYIDGPFYPEGASVRARANDLHDKVYAIMRARSAESDCDYIAYRPRDAAQ